MNIIYTDCVCIDSLGMGVLYVMDINLYWPCSGDNKSNKSI